MHVVVLLVLGAVCANVATLIFARTAMRESEIVVRSALGASRARVITQIVTESLVLALAGAVIGLVVAQTIVRYAGTRTTLGIDEGLPFWVDLTLEPATIAYALLLALIAAVLIGVLPALKATGAAVQRGLQGMTSAGTAMKFGGIWSFIIGAQVAFTLICLPAAAGIFTELVRDQATHSEFPAERFLTFRLSMDSEALPGRRGVPDDAVVGARRALAYEELARRLREEPGVTHVTFGDRLPAMSPQLMPVEVQRDGAEPVRLQGNYDGYIASPRWVTPTTTRSAPTSSQAVRCIPATPARRTGPSSSTRRSCARSVRVPSARACARCRGAAPSRDRGTRSSA
jgi:putative ABC transport system permease protein